MRICLVSQEYPPETARGGIGTQNYVRSHGLTGLGHEVIVISHSLNHERHEYKDGAVRVIRVPGFDERLPIDTEPVRWLTYSVAVATEVRELHSQTPLDLVVFPEWGGEGYIHLLNQTEWNHIPTVVHIHGSLSMFSQLMGWPEIDSEFYRVGTAMESTCLRLADAVSASSQFSRDWCVRHYQLKRESIPVLHTGVDTELFFPHPILKSNRPNIIFVGNVSANKGIAILVEAACRLAKEFPALELQILGRGDMRLIEEARKKAIAAGFPDLIEFAGYVERKQLPHYLSRAHVFAGLSAFEGGPGNVYLEAMACALPVIAPAGTGVSELVKNDETGFLVPPKDLDALIIKLRELLSNAELRESMGEEARQCVLKEAESKVCLKRLENFYRRVASGEPYAWEASCR